MQQSLWLQTASPFQLGKLNQDITCDVCIVGGGLSGVYTAYLLANAGYNVVLVEARDIASGATGMSTGKLSSQQDLIYTKLLEQFSKEEAALYFKCQKQAIKQASELASEPILTTVASTLYATTSNGVKELQHEYEAYKILDIPCKLSNDHELPIQTKATLTIHNDAQINPVLFTHQLVHKAQHHGAQFFDQTRIQRLHMQQQYLTTMEGATIHYKKLILCTHYPIEAVKKLNLIKLRIERAYLLATKVDSSLTQQYLSVEKPTRSIRTSIIGDDTYMILAGSSHPAGSNTRTTSYYEALQDELRISFQLQEAPIHWSSQDIETPDILPYIGPITKHDPTVFVATGFRKWGLANSLVAGELLLAYLTNNPLIEREMALFSPNRTALGKTLAQALQIGSTVIGELIGGHIMRRDSPKCTHLGCKTRWNEADETWDCPCHGSRFTKNGEIVEGPAVYPLDL